MMKNTYTESHFVGRENSSLATVKVGWLRKHFTDILAIKDDANFEYLRITWARWQELYVRILSFF